MFDFSDPTFIVISTTTIIGAVAYGVRLEGRLNGHDTLLEERKEQEAQHFQEVKDELKYIRQRVDQIGTRLARADRHEG